MNTIKGKIKTDKTTNKTPRRWGLVYNADWTVVDVDQDSARSTKPRRRPSKTT